MEDLKREKLGTGQKALEINLNAKKYGTFAEIGAGQEVVRWYFRVGAAANTIAKSISAYDMTISDAIYGGCDRYVSRQRLEMMLDYEYKLLVERLDPKRGAETDFFAFADTVATRNFKGTNECHGWMGVKFQSSPRSEPNCVLLHVRMLDIDRVAQQEALGVVGINLCYGCFSHFNDPFTLMESLLDNLTSDRIEVDMIHFSGPDFEGIDHRLMAVKLVELELSDAAMFRPDGEVLQPSEVLYKRPVVVERGSFRPVTHTNMDMLECARAQFIADGGPESENPVVLFEITRRNLFATGEIDYDDFLSRIELLASTGATVLISDYAEYYRLAQYLGRYTKKKIGMVMGIPSLRDLFDEKYYEHLEGGILESFGRLFKNDLRLYVYPLLEDSHHLITVPRLRVAPHLQNLYEHLTENGSIQAIDFYNRDYLGIFSRDVLRRIAEGDATWEKMVPTEVAQMIKERGYFDYKKSEGD
ncbi:MAG TPA: hypothetical protein VGB45_03470 [Abditibacterium sp.]|jgi:hypothetical protein